MSDKTDKLPGEMDVDRRRLLQALGLLIGASSASTLFGDTAVSAALAYRPKKGEGAKRGRIFTPAELRILRNICAIVIPKTDTPGAAEVDVHGFIDNQLFHCHSAGEQAKIKELLGLVDKMADRRYGAVFSAATESQRYTLLTDLDRARAGFSAGSRDGFRLLKGLIAFGYYTSEPGATRELAYLAVPGGFRGSVPYASLGRAWAVPHL